MRQKYFHPLWIHIRKPKYYIFLLTIFLLYLNIFTSTKIDTISLILVFLGFSPWLLPLINTREHPIKSLELPGGLKIEFGDAERITEEATKAGLIQPNAAKEAGKYSLISIIAREDRNLALAALRVEIERKLRVIAEKHRIDSDSKTLRWLVFRLVEIDALSSDEANVINDINGTLNNAVHGAKVNEMAAERILEIGPQILESLDKRIPN